MLDRRDDDFSFIERGRQTRIVDGLRPSWKIYGRREINSTKDDSRVGRRRSHDELDFAPGMKADAHSRDGLLESALSNQLLNLQM